MVFIGGYIHNNGTGTIFNSSGVGAVCIGITATGTLNNCAGTIDRFGNAAFQGLGAVNLTLSGTGCSSGTYAKADGTGCGTPSGSGTPTIVGPASAFSTTSTTGATVFSYTNSIAAGSTVMLDCVGSYEFTGAAETAEFGIDLSATPQSMALNVEVGANTSTETHSLAGVQTANNTLQTGATAAATTGVFYPVTISGGVVTNASSTSTFTIVGATSNASGTLKANAKGFACSVK
jgi:hypothetical protein